MKPQPINHGTYGGAQVHRRRGEEPCEPCADASRAYQRQLRRRVPEIGRRQYHREAARRRAFVRLSEEFPARFKALMEEELDDSST